MAQTCSRCDRANPLEASYCHYDGSPLDLHSAAGTQPPGLEPFPKAFVFSAGRCCRNFHELARACCEEWPAAVEQLQHGLLEGFFTSIGRLDVARVAREAARQPDPDRGLDQLVSHFPGLGAHGPRLRLPESETDLGPLSAGSNHQFEIELVNDGLRLLSGTVTCGCNWLSLGGEPGVTRRPIQFGKRLGLPLRVLGDRLRAGPKPLEASLFIDSNGGQALVLVRAEVRVRPFADGVLAGARSPRQLAEKARAAPREAAALFQDGAVAEWYRQNGWTYPVQGQPAWGVGAVQQFLRALGLPDTFGPDALPAAAVEPAPSRLELSEPAVRLSGPAGSRLDHYLTVRANGMGTVRARAVSDRAWLQVGPTVLDDGRSTIPLSVLAVPDQAGSTLQARLTVVADGDQRLEVPVTLVVLEAPRRPEQPPSSGSRPTPPRAPRQRLASKRYALLAGVPILLLLGLLVRGLVVEKGPPPLIEPPIEPQPRLALAFDSKMRFGLVLPGDKDLSDRVKKLTGTESGQSNSTLLRIDGKEVGFGASPGVWKEAETAPASPGAEQPSDGGRATWMYPDDLISVTQLVEIVAGPQIAAGQASRRRDTCLVRYRIENRDDRTHRVGLRMLLDTHAGSRDGEPFWLPGQALPCTTNRDIDLPADRPDFLQILERPSLEDPGVVSQLTLRPGGRLEAPSRVKVGAWPREASWDEPLESLAGEDSAVVLYWQEKNLGPGESREVGFAYGLGPLSNSESAGNLAVAVGGTFRPGEPFTVAAYVAGPSAGQTVTLTLPRGCELVQGEATQVISPPTDGPRAYLMLLSWRVRASYVGTYTLRVQSSSGHVQSQPITIRALE